MRLVMAVSAVLGVLWFGVSNLEFADPDGLSEVGLLLSAGLTLWVAGVLARHSASATDADGNSTGPADPLTRPRDGATAAGLASHTQTAGKRSGKPATMASA